ncbi:hypothetical protein P8452_38380 [Trifolium repens]|nr:hypothetical protein P8452_38380 [Trifolium repens]
MLLLRIRRTTSSSTSPSSHDHSLSGNSSHPIWHGKSKPNYSRASELLNNNDEVKEDTRCDKSGKGQKHIATDV